MVLVMTAPLLGLVMIVKNEAHGLADTLRSFKPHVDHWLVFDTGSTDGTQAIVHAELDGIPGVLVEGDFIDFATARNRALEAFEKLYPDVPFVVMPDADDILTRGHALRAFLEPLRDNLDSRGIPEDRAYLLNLHRGADLDYYLPIVMRTAAKCRYRGRVHECLDYIATTMIPTCVLAHHARPPSLDATRARWERDRELLQQDIVADPANARAWFYLAQTYECLGIPEGAVEFYQRRITLGGFPDEVFEARRRIGKIWRALGKPWPETVAINLEAHLADPRRAEPLHEIAEIFHEGDHHALTYLFASRAAMMPRPVTTLFVDPDVYAYKAADLAAISAFYVAGKTGDPGVYESGRMFAERCVKAKGDMRMRANLTFYTRDAAHLAGPSARGPACVLEEIGWKPEAPYHAGNPSIARVRSYNGGRLGADRWLCLLRTTNYSIVNGQYLTPDDNVIYTRNVMLELDEQLAVTRAVPMKDLPLLRGEPRTDFAVHGYEDCRLFSDEVGRLYATATVCDLEGSPKGSRELCLLVINPTTYAIESCAPLRGPWSAHPQKNWMPIGVIGGTAHFVYRTEPGEPMIAEVTLDPVSCALRSSEVLDVTPGYLRGGSQVVPVFYRGTPARLAIVHDVVFPGGMERIYSHRFVVFNNACTKILGMSDRFYFQRRGIEFCAGLATDGDQRLVASFSVQDSAAYFATFDLPTVLSAIKTEYVV